MILHLDFETRSVLELPEVGVWNYVSHPTTDIWCVAWAFDDNEPKIWHPGMTEPPPLFFPIQHHCQIRAHNAVFEYLVWNHIMAPRYGWPLLKISQMRCSMAQCYSMALPGSLDRAAAALGVPQQKDLKGGRLMLQMSRPKEFDVFGEPHWWDEPDKLEQLFNYCRQDIRVEQALGKRLLPLSPSEQKLWELDAKINEFGIPLDRPAIEAALAIIDIDKRRLSEELRSLTGNRVGTPAEVAALTRWLADEGVGDVDGLAKADIVDLLGRDGLSVRVRRALEIRQDYAKTSNAKLDRMRDAVSEDHRIRHTMQFCGAGTGRWAGRRLQPHNLPKPKILQHEIEDVIEFLPRLTPAEASERIETLYGGPLSIISDCLRGMIAAPPGKILVAGDFSNIEGRVLAWLAGEEWKLQAFRDFDAGVGPDLYLVTAGKIYHRPASDFTKKSPEREVGKRCELAFGYQGGKGAWRKFETYATKEYVRFSDDKVEEIKVAWREAHPKIQQFWWDLENAVKEAVTHPNSPTHARGVIFVVRGSFLFCKLPSGRVLTYPYPKLKMTETPWGELREQVHYMHVDGLTNKWEETHTYGGKVCENITQAVARDVLADALVRLDRIGYHPCLHVHDEVVIEEVETSGADYLNDVLKLMSEVPSWATGLPIAVEGWAGRRYRK